MKQEKLLKIQNEVNKKLTDKLESLGIKKVTLISLGNSIASGYSLIRTLKPLLLRNESIEKHLKTNDIDLDIHHFARAQNNGDEHIFDWIISDIKESEINKMVRNDYDPSSAVSMGTPGLDRTKINDYYPIEIEDDRGLNEIILSSDENLANIVVYNGCTGSFLDNVTRSGKISQKLTYGLKRDIKGLEATLKYIQHNNRHNGTNTQVYICGAPNWLGIHLTDILNNKLKRVAMEYANTTYVDSVTAKMIYKKLDASNKIDANEAQSLLNKIPFPGVDMHYDETEYLKLNNNIVRTINDNYLIKQALINIDRRLYKYNSFIEKEGKSEYRTPDFQNIIILEAIKEQYKLFNTKEEKGKFVKIASKYLIERFPYDFYYLGKKNIKDNLKEVSDVKHR